MIIETIRKRPYFGDKLYILSRYMRAAKTTAQLALYLRNKRKVSQ